MQEPLDVIAVGGGSDVSRGRDWIRAVAAGGGVLLDNGQPAAAVSVDDRDVTEAARPTSPYDNVARHWLVAASVAVLVEVRRAGIAVELVGVPVDRRAPTARGD